MTYGVQILGIIFVLFMIYLTHLYYKRQNYGIIEFITWICIWLSFLFVILFPNVLRALLKPLKIYRLMDLLTIASFMILFIMVFSGYIANRRNEKKINKIVREIALRDDKNEKWADDARVS